MRRFLYTLWHVRKGMAFVALCMLLACARGHSTEMTTFNLACQANARAQVAQALLNAKARTTEVSAIVNTNIAKWSLVTLAPTTFGFLASNDGNNYCSITSGLKVLTTPNACWTAADVGKTIHVQGAGAAGATLVTTITAYTSSGSVTLNTAAGTTIAASKTSLAGIAIWGYVAPNIIEIPSLTNADGTLGYFRSLTSENGASVANVRAAPYNAVGDNVADDTAAIQAALNTGLAVYIPAGTYKITAPLNIPSTGGYRIYGDGKMLSILKASGTFAKVLNIGDNAGQTIRGCIQDIKVDGTAGTVTYGIYGTRVEEHDFIRVAAFGFTTAGFSVGFGYVNNYLQCEASYCTGNGFETNIVYGTGGNNAIVYRDCLALANDGFGIKVTHGYNLVVSGCTIEQCKKGGIWLNFVPGAHIQGYFEGNAVTGHTYTTPAVTVKADILLNGSGNDTDMDGSYPCSGVVIEACTTAPRVTSNAFVWNAGGVDVSLKGCYSNAPSYVSALVEHYRDIYKGTNVKVEHCSTFATQVSEYGATTNINNTYAASVEVRNPSDMMARRNYANTDLNTWTNLAAGTAGTYRRSTTAALYTWKNQNVWEFNSTVAGTGHTFGYTITATDFPELVGKQVWLGMWVYITDADCYLRPHCSVQTFNDNPTTVSTWKRLSVSITWPASGTLDFGIVKKGPNTGTVYFTAPMICPLGVPGDEAIALTPKSKQWYGIAVPSAGTWTVGDRVVNSVPTVGQPKAWSCTAAGTPGTWSSEGNL